MRRKSLPSAKGNTQLEMATPPGPLDFLLRPAPPAPSDTGQPSISVNDPSATFDALAFLRGRPNGTEPTLSTADPDTALFPGGDGVRSLAPQTPHHDLMRLRFKFPHLQIVPFPNSTKTIALVANVAADLSLPDSAVLAMFRGNGDYYISANGAASIPTNALNDDSSQACASAFKPEGFLFYLGNVNQISLIAPTDTIVTVLFYNGE